MKLFGGAIESKLPQFLVDASKFREVPDTQECFVSEGGHSNAAMIIDLCEQVKPDKPLIEALDEHIREVHRLSDTQKTQVLSTCEDRINNYDVAVLLEVVDSGPSAKTAIYYALFRLEAHRTDVLVTYTVSVDTKDNDFLMNQSVVREGEVTLTNFIKNFTVVDPCLFVD